MSCHTYSPDLPSNHSGKRFFVSRPYPFQEHHKQRPKRFGLRNRGWSKYLRNNLYLPRIEELWNDTPPLNTNHNLQDMKSRFLLTHNHFDRKLDLKYMFANK